MKNKQSRHKESNTFKFQPFSERICHLDIDVFHRIGHKNEEFDEDETFFYQTLQKWNLLNLSECYEEFRRELPSVETLPLLLNHQDVVIEVILKHLSKPNPLALEAILDLLVALMRDLRHEVLTSYNLIFKRLCELLVTKNADELEWIFKCLAYMFKYLWRYIVKDVDTVFENLVPLFSDSKPPYIKNFAAESFAYVVRKVKNKRDFVKLVLKTLETQPNSIEGCGRLMFEVLRGVRGRFHSFADDFLPLVLEMLYDSSVNSELLYRLLSHMFYAMCSFIEPKHFSFVWKSAFDVVFKNDLDDNKTFDSNLLVFKIFKQILKHKDGICVSEPVHVSKCILKLLKDIKHEILFKDLAEIVASILLSQNVHLPQENARQLTLNVLNPPFKEAVVDFICQILEYSGFESFVLSWVQNYTCNEIQNCLASSAKSANLPLSLLSRIILHKSPPCMNGLNLANWQKYPLNLNTVSKEGGSEKSVCIFESLIQLETYWTCLKNDNTEELISVLIVLPHINLLHKEIVCEKLAKLMKDLCSSLRDFSESRVEKEDDLQKELFLFLNLLEAQIHLMDFQDVEDTCTVEFMFEVILPFIKHSKMFCALSVIDLYITAMDLEKRDKNFSLKILKRVYVLLSPCVSSPIHKVRLLATHIFSLFMVCEDSLYFLKTCFDVESILVNVQNFRDKLLLLDKLSLDVIGIDNEYLDVALGFLLGVLYENFQLLWEPVMNLITTYAQGMNVSKFWNIFGLQLRQAVLNLGESRICAMSTCYFASELLNEMFNKAFITNDKTDYSNYRLLLWKAFAKFPELCEMKSRDASPLFLNFLEKEYFKANSINAQFCCIKLQPQDSNDLKSGLLENNAIAEKRNDDKGNNAILYNTLLAHLSVFAKLRSPRTIYREPELRENYLSLLMSKNPNIQKSALDCVMTYKEKCLAPYSEHLYGLLNDKKFKDEITLFQIDKETSLVQEEHRTELMPVLIRILYGRMTAKLGSGGTGKASSKLQKSLVLRFLSGCQEMEMIMFLKLAFKVYIPLLHGNAETMVQNISESIDLNNVISLRSIQSSLDLLLIVMEKFGALMSNEVLKLVLYILMCIGSLITNILAHKNEIQPGYASGIRTLLNTSLMALAKFFSHFTVYPWNSADVDVLFGIFVWPNLEKLPIEGIHSPTALLKLFVTWSKEPRYFNLLIKNNDKQNVGTPLSAVMKLLAAPKIQSAVTKVILEILESLLTTADNEEENVPEVLNSGRKIQLNYGSKILLPHVPDIIQHLQQKLNIKKRKGLSTLDLLILSRVCELVTDPETSENLLKLLFLTFLKKMNTSEETVLHLVSTVCSLLINVPSPFQYLKCIAPLFESVSSVCARKLLCGLLNDLAERNTESNKPLLLENVKLVHDINAWDAKWIEQPDFFRRLEGLKLIHEMMANGKIMLEFGVLIVYNCFYFLENEKDLALKDSSGYCLRKLCPYLCKQALLTKNPHVSETILKLIATGIRSESNESLHDETILLLGELVRECCDAHKVLLDLKDLACKEDPEVDFFNNIIHLQSHRRARALMRFCSVGAKVTKPLSTRTLTQFILPLVTTFLCSEKYANKKNIVDAAVQTLEVVCKFLPWFHYEAVLKYYLQKLHTLPAFQKQLVCVVIGILEAFHFDVSLVKEIPQGSKKDNVNFSHKNLSVDNDINKKECVEEKIIEERDEENKHEVINMNEEEENVKDEVDPKTLEEDLENALQNISEDETGETEAKVLSSEEPFISRFVKLSESAATRIVQSITEKLLPHLQRSISLQKKTSMVHKVNRKTTAFEQEEEDTMRIPIALAIVKLLQQLPSQFMDQHLPGIFLSICTFLKSRLQSVRRVTREMLQTIMASLGPSYLHFLLREMIALLTKGYQIHVLIFTIHSVLVSMKPTFKAGDMDSCLHQILEICKMDLFGKASEEKGIGKITGKVTEARSHKSYDTLIITAQFITEKCFVDLLLPFKEVLMTSYSYSTITLVSDCLRQIVNGLYANTFVSVESLLIFIYGVASGKIDALRIQCVKKESDKKQQNQTKQPDSFLIPSAPRTRYGAITAKPSVSSDRNAHVFAEFAFSLLHIVLKRGKASSNEFAKYIDPMIPILLNNMDAQHVKLTITTLNCFTYVFKADLPNLRKNIDSIAESLFSLLHKYATAGLTQGEYMDMVIAAFKAVTILVREVNYHAINDHQLKALLLYVEHDIENFTRQATAFPLLKAILSRKLDTPEIYEVMGKVAKLSIISNHDHVRKQARFVFYHFLMNYPLGRKVERHINFYLSQIRYELEPGRMSAYKIIHRMIATFPEKILSNHAGIFFVAIGASLVNDRRPKCKEMAARCLNSLIRRDEKDRDKLFNIALLWLKDSNTAHQTLGAQVCGIFAEIESDKFLRHIQELIPILQNQLSAKRSFLQGKCVKAAEEQEQLTENKLKLEDHCTYQILQLMKKICSFCTAFLSDNSWMHFVNDIGNVAQHLLGHPHDWIRLEASIVLGHIFARLDIKSLVKTVASSSFVEGRFLFHDTLSKLKSLVLDFCAQLVPNDTLIDTKLIDQVIKNLAFLSRVVGALTEGTEECEVDNVKISLTWFIRRMRKIINMEIVQTPSSFKLREAVFKWIGALVVDLSRERLRLFITQILTPLIRELLNEEDSNPDIIRLSKGVTKLIKSKLGMEEYTSHLSKVQIHLSKKKAIRKRERIQEVVHNPEVAAKRKIQKQQRKKMAKKRKIDEYKGRVAPKRKYKMKSLDESDKAVQPKKWVVSEIALQL